MAQPPDDQKRDAQDGGDPPRDGGDGGGGGGGGGGGDRGAGERGGNRGGGERGDGALGAGALGEGGSREARGDVVRVRSAEGADGQPGGGAAKTRHPKPAPTPGATEREADAAEGGSTLRGIGLKVASVVVFMAMASCIKAVATEIPPGETVFFRSFFALPPLLIWLALRGELSTGFRVNEPWGHLWRGLVGGGAMALNFAAFAYLPLTEVIAITYAAPLFVTVLAAMFLNERVRLYRLAAVTLGMAGVAIVLSPRLSVGPEAATDAQMLGAMLALFAAVLMALAQVFVRKLIRTESTSSIVFWFSVTCTGMALLTIPFGWVWPTPVQAGLLVMAGLLGGVAQILLTSAYRHAEVGVIAPFEYVSMVLAIGVGWFVFAETPTGVVLAGAALIATGGILIIWRERQLGLERAQAKSAKGMLG